MIQIILAIAYVVISLYLHYQTYKLYRREQEKNEQIRLYIKKESQKCNLKHQSGRFRIKALRDIKRKINEIRL